MDMNIVQVHQRLAAAQKEVSEFTKAAAGLQEALAVLLWPWYEAAAGRCDISAYGPNHERQLQRILPGIRKRLSQTDECRLYVGTDGRHWLTSLEEDSDLRGDVLTFQASTDAVEEIHALLFTKCDVGEAKRRAVEMYEADNIAMEEHIAICRTRRESSERLHTLESALDKLHDVIEILGDSTGLREAKADLIARIKEVESLEFPESYVSAAKHVRLSEAVYKCLVTSSVPEYTGGRVNSRFMSRARVGDPVQYGLEIRLLSGNRTIVF